MTLGIALLAGLFTVGAETDNIYHAQFVLAFAVPIASLAYDRYGTRKSILFGSVAGAAFGTATLSGMILCGFYG